MIYHGIITGVHPPGDMENLNKYQYEYDVIISTNDFAQIPLKHVVRSDPFGSLDDYEDNTLFVGNKVIVAAFNRQLTLTAIIGCLRKTKTKMDSTLAPFLRKRFNKIEELWDTDSNWSITLDTGPSLQVQQDNITANNSKGEKISLDNTKKQVTIEGRGLNITIKGDATISIEGKANLSIGGDVILNTKGNLTATVDKTATITAKEKAIVEAPSVSLGKSAGEAVIKGNAYMTFFNTHTHLGNLGAPTAPPTIPMDPSMLSKKVKTE